MEEYFSMKSGHISWHNFFYDIPIPGNECNHIYIHCRARFALSCVKEPVELGFKGRKTCFCTLFSRFV